MIPQTSKIIKQISWRRISQSEIRNSATAEKNWNRKARAGKKEEGWGEGIFARPRFPAATEFRANEVGTPHFIFLFLKVVVQPTPKILFCTILFVRNFYKFL